MDILLLFFLNYFKNAFQMNRLNDNTFAAVSIIYFLLFSDEAEKTFACIHVIVDKLVNCALYKCFSYLFITPKRGCHSIFLYVLRICLGFRSIICSGIFMKYITIPFNRNIIKHKMEKLKYLVSFKVQME